ncbi:MAG: amidase [Paracoccaceae bacterium]|nr:amidase [Paracoccaceae bacterium]
MAPEAVTKANPALAGLTALEARDLMASGALSARDYVEALIAVVEDRETEVRAWAWLDADFVRDQADRLDLLRRSGRPVGPLHGLPVALKDIVDTLKIPTENGTAIDRGRVAEAEAWIVSRLREAGAILMGKSVTTELAFMHPGATTNPHNPAHTPGGSSSGSAAAVAAGMVPLAVGTQTAGSVIRPASYCGVTGFKPSFGAIPRTGILQQSATLDTVGVFARTPQDAALLSDVFFGHDPADPATAPTPPPRLLATASEVPPLTPVFAFVKPPGWEETATDETKAAFGELTTALGEGCFEVPLPAPFDDAADLRWRIHFAELAKCYHRYGRHPEALSEPMRDAMAKGEAVTAKSYLAALDWREVLYAATEEILEHADAILTLAAPGPAPEGLARTGDAIFNGLWTYLGMPAITLPLLEAENGLPMGVQLVARRDGDGRLLRTARWLYDWVDAAGTEDRR